MHAKFFLVAEPQLMGFKLHREGEKWEEPFHTIRQAVRYVRSLPDHDGDVIVLNSVGQEISHIHIEEPAVENKPSPSSHATASQGVIEAHGTHRKHRHRHKSSSRRSSQRRRARTFPWLHWLIIALVVIVILVVLLSRVT